MDSFLSAFQQFAGQILTLLPKSPTVDNEALQTLATYAGYINYFIPVGAYLTFLAGCLACLAVYYAAQIILRWVKVIS